MISHPNVKINLGLSVLRRREDGFHDIETVFLPYDGYCDTLEIVQADKTSIIVEGPYYTGWDPCSDLVFKAWKLLADECGVSPVGIRLCKTSPVGAGLGGGSSDAVAALKMMDELFGLALGRDRLLDFAGRLGSDCSFFVDNEARFAEGRGEILSEAPVNVDAFEIRVAVPEGESVSTKEAYSDIVPRNLRPDGGLSLREALALPVREWRNVLRNDFEDTVFPAHPAIARLKRRFYDEGAVYASMSGSGSAVFGLFEK